MPSKFFSFSVCSTNLIKEMTEAKPSFIHKFRPYEDYELKRVIKIYYKLVINGTIVNFVLDGSTQKENFVTVNLINFVFRLCLRFHFPISMMNSAKFLR